MLPKNDSQHDKLHKVRPIIDDLNVNIKKNIKKSYVHSKIISIDESMTLFKDRSTLKQYMPMKPNVGIKFGA